MRRISPLKVEIIQRGLTQSDVAYDAKISESRLSRILNGRVEPQEVELQNLRRVLDLGQQEAAA